MTTPQPTIGRIVHYVSLGTPNGEFLSQHRAAVVTEVLDPKDPAQRIGLCVLNPSGIFFNSDIAYAADCHPGTWHWPEREQDGQAAAAAPVSPTDPEAAQEPYPPPLNLSAGTGFAGHLSAGTTTNTLGIGWSWTAPPSAFCPTCGASRHAALG